MRRNPLNLNQRTSAALRRMDSWPNRYWLLLVAAAAALERGLLYLFYPPVPFHDTGTYQRLAQTILNGWGSYDGTRTPGYPFFLAMFGSNRHVYLAQLALGFLTTLLFFYIGWRATGKGWAGALAAFAYTLNIQQVFFEANLITESITTFFITLTAAGVAAVLCSAGRRPALLILAALAAGLASGAAALVRPLFIFLPVLTVFFLLLAPRPARSWIRWAAPLTVALAGFVLVGAWVNFIHSRFGRWDLSTLTGYQLTQHTGPFFQYAPAQYSLIRDTFIKYRDAQLAATGSATDAIWDAIPELERVSGLNMLALSDVLADISYRLILAHPFLFLRSVVQSWLWFWKAPFYWSPLQFPSLAAQSIGRGLVFVQRSFVLLSNLLFISGSIALAWRRVRRILKPSRLLVFFLSVVWLTSFLQALLNHGDNSRMEVPVQSLVILVILWWAGQLLHSRWQRS